MQRINKKILIKTKLIHSISIVLQLSLFSFYYTSAQNNLPSIKHFSLEEGLSQVTINDLLQDKTGFVWIATQDGLNRFDGTNFKHYKYQELDSTSIPGNLTNVLLEDKNTNIWVGSIGNGLSYYNQKLERFYKVKLKYAKNENETISDLDIDNQGNVWVASRLSGLHKLKSLENNTFLQENYFNNQSLSALLYQSNNNNLWVGDFNGNVYKINSSESFNPNIKPEFTIKSRVRCFFNTGKHLLIGSDYGLYIYTFKSKKLELFKFELENLISVKFISSFLKGNDDSVWIGTGNGLFLLNWKKMKIIREIEKSKNNKDLLSNNTVTALLNIDKDKILVGTANNLNLLNFKPPLFKNISKNKQGNHLLNDNVIFSILRDKTDLWVGTSDGGLNLIRNGVPYYFEKVKNDSSITFGTVREIIKDHKNQRLWVATTRGLRMLNLKTFDPKQPKFKVFRYNPNDINSISGDFLKGMTLDYNNNIWGATYGYGIFRLEIKNNDNIKITRYENNPVNKNSLQSNVTMCVKTDRQNNVWIGTQGGLTKLYFNNNNYTNPVFTNYNKNSSKKESLSNNSVYDILIDKNDSIWLGTRHGLNLFTGNNTFVSWKEQSQFPNAAVYSIQDDNKGNLWLGTNDGLVKFNTKNRKFTQYSTQDGIQSNEFDIHAKFKDSLGTIYLGGIGGVTYFNPEEIEAIDIKKTIYFSELKIKDSVIKPNSKKNNVLSKSIINTSLLEFKHNQFPFYLEFSSIDFRHYKNVKYGYKLLPTDENWNMLTGSKIQFLNLPSGKYTLQINGFSRGIEWDKKPLEMKLNISPPWWLSTLAYFGYFIILISLAYLFYRFQLSRKLAVEESLRLKEVNLLKNSLYTNITHEFRTPLTVILGMVESLKLNVQDRVFKGADKSLELIHRNSESLLQLVNRMLDLAKLESGVVKLELYKSDVIPYIKYVCESYHSLAQANSINLTIYSEIDHLEMDFDANKLSSIISNVLSNAIKFTPENGKIIVHLNHVINLGHEFLLLKIKDNGLGLTENDLLHVFNRFYQADSSTSRSYEGTGIGLALTKELVNLMHGDISVKSKLGKGSEFIIKIPVTRNAILSLPQTPLYTSKTTVLEESIEAIESINSNLPIALIIEDNIDVVHYLKTCLENKYQVQHAINGRIGIDMAYENIPDIIISDVMMPEKDGFEVCSTLKSDERTNHIPIILLTAKVSNEDRLTGLSLGADAYLSKPFNKEELYIRLDQLLLLRKKIIAKFKTSDFNDLVKKPTSNPEDKFLKKIISIIHEDINNHAFGSKELAKKLFLSESQVYRKLKAISGKSTALFIRSIRLQKSKDLIQTTNRTIAEIAYDVGFNDPSWFSRAFKEEFGLSPSEFK
ncbi:hybrid sensor histidine kinase/response regulator transcription factor [Lacinutrix sp. Bg11-31]|uniref:hybrid sensor histidine kinase/response regulator transcription factor n=1 Tax=Lacinutrix sp. Bg11-31 TaxID=2057808 RepID=UPI000C312142|nr:hybrid sensor histidine kinase/response regulator transcription factor [Lacinutrix sp. Bg11-31]AUC81025.1 hypothetical protein CW733_02290 [Lacinutrix sp. Bg11-31]